MAKTFRNKRGALAAAEAAGFAAEDVNVVEVSGGKFMWAPKDDPLDPIPADEAAAETVEAEQYGPDATLAAEATSDELPPDAPPTDADVAAYFAASGTPVDGAETPDAEPEGDAAEPLTIDGEAEPVEEEEDPTSPEALARRQAERKAAADAEASERAAAEPSEASEPEPDEAPEGEGKPADPFDTAHDEEREAEEAEAEGEEPKDAEPDPLAEVFDKLDEHQRLTLRTGCGCPDSIVRLAPKFRRGHWLQQVAGMIDLGLVEEVTGPMLATAPGDEATKGPNSRFRLTDMGRALCPLAYEEVGMPPIAPARRVLIVVEATTHSAPDDIANELAARFGGKYAVTVRDAATYATLHTGDPSKGRPAPAHAAPRAAAAPRAPRDPKPTQEGTYMAELIARARRPQGVTRLELAKEVTDKKLAWTTMLKRAAAVHGFKYHSVDGADRRTTYYLLDADATPPANPNAGVASAVAAAAAQIAAE